MSTPVTFDHTVDTVTPGAPTGKGAGKAKTVSTKTAVTEQRDLPHSGRYEVGVTLPADTRGETPFEGGFGESFMMDKAWNKGNKLVEGGALTPGAMQARLDHTSSAANQAGASVILDEDRNRGGFTVQTAYPTQAVSGANTASDVSTSYVGAVPKSRKTDKLGKTTEVTKNAKIEGVPLPAATPSGDDDEARLARSLARIPAGPVTKRPPSVGTP